MRVSKFCVRVHKALLSTVPTDRMFNWSRRALNAFDPCSAQAVLCHGTGFKFHLSRLAVLNLRGSRAKAIRFSPQKRRCAVWKWAEFKRGVESAEKNQTVREGLERRHWRRG